jgi:hypothetical protein
MPRVPSNPAPRGPSSAAGNAKEPNCRPGPGPAATGELNTAIDQLRGQVTSSEARFAGDLTAIRQEVFLHRPSITSCALSPKRSRCWAEVLS